jgi:hypothetical protein
MSAVVKNHGHTISSGAGNLDITSIAILFAAVGNPVKHHTLHLNTSFS